MRLLLDTNIYSAMAAGGDSAVENLIRSAEGVVMSAIVVGELLHGFRAGNRFRQNLGRLDSFLDEPQVQFLAVTRATCDRFGVLMAGLRDRGKPIPSNDAWIAAHALESGATLVSRDRHFAFVAGLDLLVP
ncbi:MAG: type II toxin-antitoxin system VapC family toxin [Planctomycetia bacterium]|nr:type II toxin-antitoxin system VapC family toxin [Planctomycetia bacterium]